ncbi:cysteine hydrolase [Actinoplanes sp. NPDC051494]|uniref:cysteine hydrolase n=1 Tax=Actinoplanes sp. NPDC051494 TaxID=3363907 RepID=UPI00379FE10B
MTVKLASAALIVIDMQRGFVRPQTTWVPAAVADFVDRWQAAGGASAFTRFINEPDSLFERLIQWTAVRTAPETDLVDELQPYAARANAVVDKPAYTPFTPELDALVAEHGWTDLLFCGLTTESCVLKGAVDAFERGLTPWILTDASGAHAPGAQEAGLLVASRYIGKNQLIRTTDVHLSPGQVTITAPVVEIEHSIGHC